MPTEEQMTVNECRKYFKLVKPRYQKASRTEQSHWLTEMEQVTGMHRKSLLRLLHASSLERKKRSKGRGRTCGPAVEQVILVVWECLDYVCTERLTPVLPTARHLARFGSVRLSAEVETQLGPLGRQAYSFRKRSTCSQGWR